MFQTLALHHDPDLALHRLELFPRAALAAGVMPVLSLSVIEEALVAMDQVAGLADDEPGLSHLIVQSGAPAFALGADLGAVVGHLDRNERSELRHYLHTACRFAHRLHGHLHPRVHTLALVQGTAMGGGFEVALGCETLIAEQDVKLGLPETAFGSFAGCGGPSFLHRLVGQTMAMRLLRCGKVWTSQELAAMGVIEHLVPKGEGAAAALEMVRKQRLAGSTLISLKKVREALDPLTLEELTRVADIWVEDTFALGPAQRATMRAIVESQAQRMKKA